MKFLNKSLFNKIYIMKSLNFPDKVKPKFSSDILESLPKSMIGF